jgi:hypothetical protein
MMKCAKCQLARTDKCPARVSVRRPDTLKGLTQTPCKDKYYRAIADV